MEAVLEYGGAKGLVMWYFLQVTSPACVLASTHIAGLLPCGPAHPRARSPGPLAMGSRSSWHTCHAAFASRGPRAEAHGREMFNIFGRSACSARI